MNSRDRILRALRATRHEPTQAPAPFGPALRYAEPSRQFVESFRAVGGEALCFASRELLPQALSGLAVVNSAERRCSLLPDLVAGNVELETIRDPHELEDLDVIIAQAQFGVAENGALWIDDSELAQRVALFIAQHVVFVLEASAVVDNMHQAYARLTFSEPGFGVFVSGPSKTADIEQSLVIGAHGPRSATVLLWDETDAGAG
ncbi:MAG: lactate utilization protein [Proteobacteria bacterium]|nr:lactate utilization protein [Pseudomonadota bacterium]